MTRFNPRCGFSRQCRPVPLSSLCAHDQYEDSIQPLFLRFQTIPKGADGCNERCHGQEMYTNMVSPDRLRFGLLGHVTHTLNTCSWHNRGCTLWPPGASLRLKAFRTMCREMYSLYTAILSRSGASALVQEIVRPGQDTGHWRSLHTYQSELVAPKYPERSVMRFVPEVLPGHDHLLVKCGCLCRHKQKQSWSLLEVRLA